MRISNWWPGVLIVALAAGPAEASILFPRLPTAYTPGVPFDFDVVFSSTVSNLNSLNVELVLSATGSSNPGPGGDFFFDVTGTIYPATQGVFGPPTGFFVANEFPDGASDRLVLSDFLLTGEVDTVSGVNDMIATVTVQTSTDVGVLSLSIDGSSLFLLTEAGGDVPELSDLVGSLPPASTLPSVTAIPEPSAACLLGALMLLGGGVACRRRRNG